MANMGHNRPPLSGYILIARKLLNHPVVGAGKPVKPADPKGQTYSRLEAWLDLLMMASYQDKKTKVGGKSYQLEAGEAVCARSFLAARWNWTDKTVRSFIEKLMGQSMVTKSREGKGQHANKLSICNYSDYQRPSFERDQNLGHDQGHESGQEEGQLGGAQKDQEGGQKKGLNESELTLCKNTINMFPDSVSGLKDGPKEGHRERPANEPIKGVLLGPGGGPAKGPHIKEYKINKKTNLKVSQKEKSDLQIALDEYNQLAERAGLAKAKMLSKSRTPKLQARLDEHGLEGWRQALANVERSSFLCGETGSGRNWKASFDFLLQQSSFLKVLEGQYGNGRIRKPRISPGQVNELREKYKAPPPTISEDAG